MNRIVLVLALVLAGACGKSDKERQKEEYERTVLHPPARPDSAAATKFLAALTTGRDQMCACKDKACAEKVDADFDKVSKALQTEAPDLAPSEAQNAQLEAVGKAFSDCRDRVSK